MERGAGAPLSPGGSLQRVFDAVCRNHASDSNHSEDLPLSAPKLTTAPSESPPLEELKRKYGGGRHAIRNRRELSAGAWFLALAIQNGLRDQSRPNGLRWAQKETESFTFKWTVQFIKPCAVRLKKVTEIDFGDCTTQLRNGSPSAALPSPSTQENPYPKFHVDRSVFLLHPCKCLQIV